MITVSSKEGEFIRLGGAEQLKGDVRIMAGSNIDLLSLVKEGRFREDLYHRLDVIHLRLADLELSHLTRFSLS